MTEDVRQEYLDDIRESLNEVPEEYRANVVRAISHDISVMINTLRIISGGAMRV